MTNCVRSYGDQDILLVEWQKRHPACKNSVMRYCLKWGGVNDLHMVKLMPPSPIITFRYRLMQVVLKKSFSSSSSSSSSSSDCDRCSDRQKFPCFTKLKGSSAWLTIRLKHTEHNLCQNRCTKYGCLCRDWACTFWKIVSYMQIQTDSCHTWDESVSRCAVADHPSQSKLSINYNGGNWTACDFCFY